MEIGTIIKKYRRERDMTQEQLAEYLRVSVSAVSQWESGKTAPDLSLIPTICHLFGISADELLGINPEQKEQRISDIETQASQYSSRGQLREAADILEAGLREYPDSYGIIYDLMYVRFNQYCGNHDCLHELDEAIHLANRILEGCTHDGYREAAKQVLCYAYESKGALDKALEIAQNLPSIYVTNQVMYARLQTGSEGHSSHQSLLSNLLDLLNQELCVNKILDDGTPAYTADEMAILYHKQLALHELMIEDGNYGFFHTRLQDIHMALAYHYAGKHDTEKALHHLSAAADHAISFIACEGRGAYTCLLLRGRVTDGFSTNASANNATQMQGQLSSPTFDFLRDTPEFTAILNRLAPVAGQWKVKE
ncbi:MAG: helix-turn-helix transcriptional regulator [Clostridia bacterium]|nr:helix-turn-helix transcriptional regulator [Clostridia bacterium]